MHEKKAQTKTTQRGNLLASVECCAELGEVNLHTPPNTTMITSETTQPRVATTSTHPAPRRSYVVNTRIAAIRATLFPNNFPIKQLAERLLSIMTISSEDRAHLFSGLKFSIIAEGNVIIRKSIPIRAMMATSTKL
jgi:hypothetical protein